MEYILICACAINREFAWSPTDDVIAFWVPEYKDTPARVTLMEIPSRKEIRVKNLFNVSEVILYYLMLLLVCTKCGVIKSFREV